MHVRRVSRRVGSGSRGRCDNPSSSRLQARRCAPRVGAPLPVDRFGDPAGPLAARAPRWRSSPGSGYCLRVAGFSILPPGFRRLWRWTGPLGDPAGLLVARCASLRSAGSAGSAGSRPVTHSRRVRQPWSDRRAERAGRGREGPAGAGAAPLASCPLGQGRGDRAASRDCGTPTPRRAQRGARGAAAIRATAELTRKRRSRSQPRAARPRPPRRAQRGARGAAAIRATAELTRKRRSRSQPRAARRRPRDERSEELEIRGGPKGRRGDRREGVRRRDRAKRGSLEAPSY